MTEQTNIPATVPAMTAETLEAIITEGKMLPCVRELAKGAKESGYSSVSTWLKACTTEELNILMDGFGVGFTNPSLRDPKHFFAAASGDNAHENKVEAAYSSYHAAASILATTTASDVSDRLPPRAAFSLLSVIVLAEVIRRRSKTFSLDLKDFEFDSGMYIHMFSVRIKLFESDAHPLLLDLKKSLDRMQIMVRCRERKEYLPSDLARDAGIPMDLFTRDDGEEIFGKSKFLQMHTSTGKDFSTSLNPDDIEMLGGKEGVMVLKADSPEEFEEIKAEIERDPSSIMKFVKAGKFKPADPEDAARIRANGLRVEGSGVDIDKLIGDNPSRSKKAPDFPDLPKGMQDGILKGVESLALANLALMDKIDNLVDEVRDLKKSNKKLRGRVEALEAKKG